MSCVAAVSNSMYISGSEEKVLRVFEVGEQTPSNEIPKAEYLKF